MCVRVAPAERPLTLRFHGEDKFTAKWKEEFGEWGRREGGDGGGGGGGQ